ncbi:MAG: DUF1311 domain-containing protein [Massilia sp.]|nr:DUF1311 domain-containing protein [Massilia sp.]
MGDLARTPRTPKPDYGEHCNAGERYYDKRNQATTTPAEWDQVRYCALASNDISVLMMLYANGFGVTRDADLAIRYACASEGALAEMEERVMHLARRKTDQSGDRFDQCDDITSGFMGGYCASIAENQAGKVRTAFLARARKAMSAPQQVAFDALLAVTSVFAASRGNVETDMSGTARAAMAIDATAREQEWLREHVAAFEKGQVNLPAPEQFAAADAELNRAYRRLMQATATDPDHPQRLAWSTVEKSSVRATQRAWLAYRDAWVRFAALRYPAIDAAALKSALTQWRSKQLVALAPE